MPIEQELTDLLKQAMRDKDARTANTVRMLKTRVMERRTAKGFTGTVDDTLVREVIAAYRKQLLKAVDEFGGGEAAREQIDELRFEIAFCERFLPRGMDEAALHTLVSERAKALGISDGKQVGRLVGDIMKSHKGQVEAGDVKRIAEALLAST